MNVFFVRPSDNGYYGISEALLDQPRSDVRVRTSLFRSTQFPLTYPLPRRLDAEMQGWHGLQAYDMLVLAGIDPEVLSPKEMRDIVAYVEHGGGLLLVGGAVSGSARIGTYEPLAAVMPVDFLPTEDLSVNARPSYLDPHGATFGMPAMNGRVQTVHAVRTRPEARILMEAGSHPLLIALERGKGRVLLLNSYPQCGTTTEDGFFTDRFYGDLVRQAALWLTGRDSAVGFASLSAPREALPGGSLRVSAELHLAGPVTVHCMLKGGGRLLSCVQRSLEGSGRRRFVVKVPPAPDIPTSLRCDLELRDGEASLLAYRSFTVAARPAVDIELDMADGIEALAPGMKLRAGVRLLDRRSQKRNLAFSARVIDPGGRVLRRWRALPREGRPLQWTLPDLGAGSYAVLATVADASDGREMRTVSRTFEVVDPQDNEHYFPLVTEALPGGDVCVDEADLRRMIDDVAAHGFNGVFLGGVGCSAPLTNAQLVRRAGERYAQALGLRLATSGHLVPSFSRSRPPDVCLLDPQFDQAVRQRLGPQLAAGALLPRLFMMEILDEPLIAPPMVCRCEKCLAEFRRRYGYDMPGWEDSCVAGMESARTDLMAFVSDYWAQVFRRCYEFKQKSGAHFDVHHTFCQLTFGSFCSRYYWRDGFAWMPFCDRFDWDTYPYIYPVWRGHMELRCPNLRYHFAGHRSLARRFGKPMGHWLDLSDRNVPHWSPPVRASSELVYTAIGQDAKLIRTFYNLTFGRNNGVRRERWDDLGAELRKIAGFSSVLTQVSKPRARLAMVFAGTDWALRHHTSPENLPAGTKVTDFPLKWDDAPLDDQFPFAGTPWNAYELLLRAFGEADLLPEQMVALGDLDGHGALALWSAHYLSRPAATQIAAFVRSGGLLLCDGIPQQDERGGPLEELDGLFGDRFDALCDDVAVARLRAGKGETLLFNTEVNGAYTNAVLAGDVKMSDALEGAIGRFLLDHGVVPHARPTNKEFEVDVLAGRNCFLMVVVNHNEADDQTRVEIPDPPSPVGWVVDMATGLEAEVARENGVASLRVALGQRRGVIFGVYPERPERNVLDLPGERFRRGEPLSYEVAILGKGGRRASGHFPVEVTVRDAAGEVRARYGGRRATTDGVYRRCTNLAVNERPGRWEIEVRDPLTRTVSRRHFEVE